MASTTASRTRRCVAAPSLRRRTTLSCRPCGACYGRPLRRQSRRSGREVCNTASEYRLEGQTIVVGCPSVYGDVVELSIRDQNAKCHEAPRPRVQSRSRPDSSIAILRRERDRDLSNLRQMLCPRRSSGAWRRHLFQQGLPGGANRLVAGTYGCGRFRWLRALACRRRCRVKKDLRCPSSSAESGIDGSASMSTRTNDRRRKGSVVVERRSVWSLRSASPRLNSASGWSQR